MQFEEVKKNERKIETLNNIVIAFNCKSKTECWMVFDRIDGVRPAFHVNFYKFRNGSIIRSQ